MKAILIDTEAGCVREVECDGLRGMQAFVGGALEFASVPLPPGDVMYVNEDGLRDGGAFFRFEGCAQPLAGQGLIVGAEWETDDAWGNHDPKSTVETIQAAVRFLTRNQVDAWGKANASEPAASITSFGADGTATTKVVMRYGAVIAGVPRDVDRTPAKVRSLTLADMGTTMSRRDHLVWCKVRAHEYVDRGEFKEALASITSDMVKHPATEAHPGIALGMLMLLAGLLETPEAVRHYINGFG